ncbi:MAG: ABC transporter substrate-binding protein [Anaerolineae bacterium]|jgi:multiple sugar transport system substrate-binding protein|nr:ABC transporter substrate-binding protein [Anaerolineae bacterium]
MKSRLWTIYTLLLVISIVLAACSPTPKPAESETGTSCGTVELQYWNPFTGPDGPFMGQMVDAFNASHPEIKVTMTSQGEYYTQLATAAAADTLPDVAIVHADQVPTQAFRNVLRPMDALVAEMGIAANDYPAGVWQAGEVAGKRYAIPLDIHPMTAFYNADLLTSAGFNEPPKTAEEFEAIAAALTGNGNQGFDITGGFPIQQIFQQMLHQFGGTEFNTDGTEATWNSEAGVKALQWMKDVQAKYSEPNLEVDAELNAFKTGTVGMVWNGIWQTSNVTGEGVEFDGRATAVPQIGPQMAVWAGSHQLTLPVHKTIDPCKDQAAAIFIKYMVENSVTWTNGGQIPAAASVRASAEFKAIEPQASIAPSVEYAFFPPSIPGITDAFGPLGEAVGAVMNGTTSDIQGALNDAAQRANEILAQNKATYGDAPTAP